MLFNYSVFVKLVLGIALKRVVAQHAVHGVIHISRPLMAENLTSKEFAIMFYQKEN